MRAQLTKEQIDHLFDFVQERNVKYVDVQHELVDHLASAVEEEMADHPAWTFDQALNFVLGRFPITGFIHFVQEKEKAMRAYWRSRQWAHLKTYFTFPKIMMTLVTFASLSTIFFWAPTALSATLYIAVFLGVFFINADRTSSKDSTSFKHLYFEPLFLVLMGVATGCFIVDPVDKWLAVTVIICAVLMYLARHRSAYDVLKRDQYMVLRTYYSSYWMAIQTALILPLYFRDSVFLTKLQASITYSGTAAFLCLVAAIYIHAMVTHFRPLLRQELQQKYPHLKLAS